MRGVNLLLGLLTPAWVAAFVPGGGIPKHNAIYQRGTVPLLARPPAPTRKVGLWVRQRDDVESKRPQQQPPPQDPRLMQSLDEDVASNKPAQTPQQGGGLQLQDGPNKTLVIFSILTAAALGGLGLGIGHFVGVHPLDALSLDPKDFLLGAFMSLPLVAVDAALQESQEDTASEVYALSIFGTKTPLPTVLAITLAMTLATGFGEETLFRGVIQQGLANNIGGIPALALASLLFGLAHKLGPSDFGFITAAGAYMGLSYLICGNLTVPIALHAFYDLLLLVQAYTRGKKLLDRTQGRR